MVLGWGASRPSKGIDEVVTGAMSWSSLKHHSDHVRPGLTTIYEKLGNSGLERAVIISSTLLSHWLGDTTDFLKKAPDVIDRLLEHGDSEFVCEVMGYANRYIGEPTKPTWGKELFYLSPDLINLVGFDGLKKVATTVEGFAKDHYPPAAYKLLDQSPAVIDLVGFDGFESVASYGGQMSTFSPWVSKSLMEHSSEILKKTGMDDFYRVVFSALEILPYSATVASVFVETSPRIIDKKGIRSVLDKNGFDNLHTIVRLVKKFPDILQNGDDQLACELMKNIPEIYEKTGWDNFEKVVSAAQDLMVYDHYTTYAFVAQTPGIIEKMGYEGFDDVIALAKGFSDTDTARGFVSNFVQLYDGVGRLGIGKVAKLGKDVAIYCGESTEYKSNMAAQLMARSSEIIDRVDIDGLNKIADMGKQLVTHDKGVATSFVKNSPEMMGSIGFSGLQNVYAACEGLARYDPEKAHGLIGMAVNGDPNLGNKLLIYANLQ